MGSVNRTIVVSVLILMATGFYHYFLQKGFQNITFVRILVGGYLLGIFASVFDLIGFGVGQVAGWILLLAVGVAVFGVIQDLVIRYTNNQLSNPTSGGPGNFK